MLGDAILRNVDDINRMLRTVVNEPTVCRGLGTQCVSDRCEAGFTKQALSQRQRSTSIVSEQNQIRLIFKKLRVLL